MNVDGTVVVVPLLLLLFKFLTPISADIGDITNHSVFDESGDGQRNAADVEGWELATFY